MTTRIAAIASARRVTSYLRTTTGTDPTTGKPTLTWWFDQAALDAEAATDGWYALLTNLPDSVTTGEILIRYKGQEVVKRRYSAFKGPLAVAPMFFKNNRRITALMTVICLALLIFCLIERRVRLAIAPSDRPRRSLHRTTGQPTGRPSFDALARLRLIPTDNHPELINPSVRNAQLALVATVGRFPTREGSVTVCVWERSQKPKGSPCQGCRACSPPCLSARWCR
ncbi:hypothetical protein ACFOWZ_23490 [Lentzea rhizosphaerae]|uniref:Transposase DDE domain-containing protein n=1 Tax=Lentzea rhizosphaerae TaxID=2041025 RepID=A0ABV8BXJ6_9PSEU